MRTPDNRFAFLAPLLLCLLLTGPLAGEPASIHYFLGCASPGWAAVFATFGLSAAANPEQADVFVACAGPGSSELPAGWLREGKLLVLEGDTPASRALGFVPSGKPPVEVRNVRDQHHPDLLIVWEQPLLLPSTVLPAGARILAEDRWTQTPLVGSFRSEAGNVLWLATGPGDSGYQRFPYLASALRDSGFVPPLRTQRLWAFFDSAYRQRADLHYLAKRWRAYGIGALHVSAWQHWEREPSRDDWLRALIEACHKQGILVYAWFELPHVSERFWAEHPECREQTALGQDAHLDWRKLINLSDPKCSERVKEQATSLLKGFDWDGANLAEIYYESLQGPGNPARFTPMNPAIRRAFQATHGFDPAELFRDGSPQHQTVNTQGLGQFLEFRRSQVKELHAEWLRFVAETTRAAHKPLHLVVTQIDDRFDTSVRDNLAADSQAILELMHQHPFTLLVEDPATIWHLGPSRYTQIANAYAPLTPYAARIAIDINIFPRYQEVYPTKQQTGMELYRLVHAAAAAFPRVALYFENTLSQQDLPLLAAAAVPDTVLHRDGAALMVESRHPVGLHWNGPAMVNGRDWAARNRQTLWLPAGRHRVEAGDAEPEFLLSHISADLRQVRGSGRHLELHYESASRAIATFNLQPKQIWLDGETYATEVWKAAEGYFVMLPPGEHLVRVQAVAQQGE